MRLTPLYAEVCLAITRFLKIDTSKHSQHSAVRTPKRATRGSLSLNYMINFVRSRAARVHRLRRGSTVCVRHIGARCYAEREAGRYIGSHVRDKCTRKYRVLLKREIFSSIYFKYREPCAMPTVHAYPREITRNRSHVQFSPPPISRVHVDRNIYKRQSLAVKIRELVTLLLSEVLVLQQICILDFVLCIRLSTFTSGKPIMLPAFFAVSARLRFSLYSMQTREFHFKKTNRVRFDCNCGGGGSGLRKPCVEDRGRLLYPAPCTARLESDESSSFVLIESYGRGIIFSQRLQAQRQRTHTRARISMYVRVVSHVIPLLYVLYRTHSTLQRGEALVCTYTQIEREQSEKRVSASFGERKTLPREGKFARVSLLPHAEMRNKLCTRGLLVSDSRAKKFARRRCPKVQGRYERAARAAHRHRSRAKGIYHRSRGVGSREHRIICC
ncbi:unnamed protein product, partial [Trichogramma brassicae]